MSSEAPPKKDDVGGGAPAWVMTFADLMSLLMCFFVLLLSFAEMDVLKFKQIAGSMKMAFGVQRSIKVKDMPKGTSVIAREFSPGRPTPTPLNEVRQSTMDDTKQTLEFTDAKTQDGKNDSAGQGNDGSEPAPVTQHTQDNPAEDAHEESGPDRGRVEELIESTQEMQQKLAQLSEKIADELVHSEKEEMKALKELAASIEEEAENLFNPDKDKQHNPEVSEQEAIKQTQADAQKLLAAMSAEIEAGIVEVKTDGNKIIVSIKEKGSFPSGLATLKDGFLPVVSKLRDSFKTMDGKIIVSGHTDNVPIKTAYFRSNWDLSSSRAVTVVHELLKDKDLIPSRFAVEGHGESKPIAPNDTAENRAKNRRVELTIIQGKTDDKQDVIRLTGAEDIEEVEQVEEAEELEHNDTDKAELKTNIDTMLDANELKNKLRMISDGLKEKNK